MVELNGMVCQRLWSARTRSPAAQDCDSFVRPSERGCQVSCRRGSIFSDCGVDICGRGRTQLCSARVGPGACYQKVGRRCPVGFEADPLKQFLIGQHLIVARRKGIRVAGKGECVREGHCSRAGSVKHARLLFTGCLEAPAQHRDAAQTSAIQCRTTRTGKC